MHSHQNPTTDPARSGRRRDADADDAVVRVRPHGAVVAAVRSRIDDVCHKLSEEGWLYKPLLFVAAYMRDSVLRHDSVLQAKDRKHPFAGITEQEFEECRDMALLTLFSSPEAALAPCVRAGFYVLAREHVSLQPNSGLICPLRP